MCPPCFCVKTRPVSSRFKLPQFLPLAPRVIVVHVVVIKSPRQRVGASTDMAPPGGFPFIRRQRRRRLLRSGLRCTAPALCGADDTLAPFLRHLCWRPYFFRFSVRLSCFLYLFVFVRFRVRFLLLFSRAPPTPSLATEERVFSAPREECRRKSSARRR